jgi:TRAP-type uncharacterized transport system substrate-binding protein
MKKKTTIILFVCYVTGLMFNAPPAMLQAETAFVTIGSGDFTGVYFPIGLAIAKMNNKKRIQTGKKIGICSSNFCLTNFLKKNDGCNILWSALCFHA